MKESISVSGSNVNITNNKIEVLQVMEYMLIVIKIMLLMLQ